MRKTLIRVALLAAVLPAWAQSPADTRRVVEQFLVLDPQNADYTACR